MIIKKFIIIILSVCLLASLATLAAFADNEDIFTYTVTDGEASVTFINYKGIKELYIPETLGGYPVTKITSIGNTGIFGSENMVEKVYIPSCVTLIGWNAFRNFDCAAVIVAADNPNYSSDESGVLFNKDKTELVSCPCSLQQKEYIFPETVKTIAYCAFEGCAFIEKIVLPNGLESLGNQSFCQMPKLREINIPEGITEIGQNMFIQCSSLEEIKLPSTLVTVSNSSLSETPLKSVIVPNGVTKIDTYAFESCKKLEYVELPSTLQTIGYEAFANCNSLKYILYRGSEEDWLAININSSNEDDFEKYRIIFDYAPETGYHGVEFVFENGLLTVAGDGEIPSFVAGDYHYWDSYASDCEAIVIDGNFTNIGAYAFENFTALEYLILYPENITVSDNAFTGCDSLESIIITGTSDFSDTSFNGNSVLKVYIDADKNPVVEPEENIIRFSYSNGTLYFIDGISLDLYHLLDLISVLVPRYGVIEKIAFANMSLTDMELHYISEYTQNGEPVIKKIEEGTLVNGEIKVKKLDGSALTFNELIGVIENNSEEGFMLIVSDENHQTIINSNVGIESPDNPPTPDEPEKPDESEDNTFIDEIELFFDSVYVNVVKAIKWAVTLMNKLFKLIRKK